MDNVSYQETIKQDKHTHFEQNECPNFISGSASLSSCGSRSSCIFAPQLPVPCQNCQRCVMAASPCIATGMVPYFPLPYVCRHWLSVSPNKRNSLQPTCLHTAHSCSAEDNIVNKLILSRPLSQIEVISPSSLILNGGAVQRMEVDVDASFSNELNSRSNSPEISIVIPDIIFSVNGVPVAKLQQVWTTEDDANVLSKTRENLEDSGWYYGDLTWQEAAALLANTQQGTFLVRNSSSSRCPFALSVQTPQGPTSIRVEYEKGKFWLDCQRKGVTPQFDDIMKLILYYQNLSSHPEVDSDLVQQTSVGKNIWVDHKGRVYSPISITKPLVKNPLSLKHFCRLAINSTNRETISNTSLPTSLSIYLSKYPYSL